MIRPHDVLDLLARTRPARLDPPGQGDPRSIAAGLVLGEPGPFRVRHARRTVLMSAGGAAVAVTAVAAGVAVTRRGPTPVPQPTSLPMLPSLTASGVLLAAADRNAATPVPRGRYLVLRTESGFAASVKAGTRAYTMFGRTLSEYWVAQSAEDRSWAMSQSLAAVPVTPADMAAWQRAGSPPVVKAIRPKPVELATVAGKTEGSEALVGIGDRTLTIEQLGEVPTEPAALRALLLADHPGDGSAVEPDQWLFHAGSLLLGTPVSNAVRAAAFRLLAGLPGVRSLGALRDLDGRTGQAITFRSDSAVRGVFEYRLFISPKSGQAVSREERAIRPRGDWSWLRPGAIVTYSLVLTSTATDENPPQPDVVG
ncbi:CU044_5270 family protein [Actinoplanes sp. NPDC051861]|uniref:CU044_5270 family protein n=1 Tax=Actinoplanes sp. NPDC051861 TaxID=3155170 RepID=UPI0034193077